MLSSGSNALDLKFSCGKPSASASFCREGKLRSLKLNRLDSSFFSPLPRIHQKCCQFCLKYKPQICLLWYYHPELSHHCDISTSTLVPLQPIVHPVASLSQKDCQSDFVIPLLKALLWLLITPRVQFKLLLMAPQHFRAPAYHLSLLSQLTPVTLKHAQAFLRALCSLSQFWPFVMLCPLFGSLFTYHGFHWADSCSFSRSSPDITSSGKPLLIPHFPAMGIMGALPPCSHVISFFPSQHVPPCTIPTCLLVCNTPP